MVRSFPLSSAFTILVSDFWVICQLFPFPGSKYSRLYMPVVLTLGLFPNPFLLSCSLGHEPTTLGEIPAVLRPSQRPVGE